MNLKEEIEKVKQLGDEIGYGQMMALASALWRKKLIDVHKMSPDGAFVPTIHSFIKKEYRFDGEVERFDEMVKHVKF